MGALCSASDEDTAVSKQHDEDGEKYAEEQVRVRKLLFLGPGDSGKSTLFRQLRSLYGKGFTEMDRKTYRSHIYKNIVFSLQALLRGTVTLGTKTYKGVEYDCSSRLDEKTKEDVMRLNTDVKLTLDNIEFFRKVWDDQGIKNTLTLRHMIQFPYDAEYYFSKLDELAADRYVPSFEDMVHCRHRTTGIFEENIKVKGDHFKVVDVGGQRSERKKWVHCFEGVTCVIFVVALSDFDQVLLEEENRNRMEEALSLFSEYANSQFLKSSAMILFFNKSDIFRKKIADTCLKTCPVFQTWEGPEPPGDTETGFNEATEYIKQLFRDQDVLKTRKIYSHVTVATDTNNVKQVFLDTKDVIIRQALKLAGLVMEC